MRRSRARDYHAKAEQKKRTLTNLYDRRSTWLDLAHKKLDDAVFAAYGWKSDLSDEEILGKLLVLNLERSNAYERKQFEAGRFANTGSSCPPSWL